MLYSVVQLNDPVICTHISPLFWISFPFRLALSSVLCVIQWVLISYLSYTKFQYCVYINSNLPIHLTTSPSSPWCPLFVTSVSVFISSLQIVSSVPFFYVPYKCVNILYMFFSFWLNFTLYSKLYVHPLQFNWLRFLPFYDRVIFHCIHVPQLLCSFICP